ILADREGVDRRTLPAVAGRFEFAPAMARNLCERKTYNINSKRLPALPMAVAPCTLHSQRAYLLVWLRDFDLGQVRDRSPSTRPRIRTRSTDALSPQTSKDLILIGRQTVSIDKAVACARVNRGRRSSFGGKRGAQYA